MRQDRLLPAGHSAAFLSESNPLRRKPRSPGRKRPAGFSEKFEARALWYDCFWAADGERILLVGPPPLNLGDAFKRAEYVAQPSATPLKSRGFASVSVMVTELSGAPKDTKSLSIRIAGESVTLPVRPNFSDVLAGSRLLFTMSKDNDLAWITAWADYHVRVQGADAVLFFDNGSTRYGCEEIEAALLAVPGLKHVAVESWPYLYGTPDPAVLNNPFYTLFLQIAAMSVALRRYGAKAQGILNCDIDELVATPDGVSIFDLAENSRHGLMVMKGQFIEAVTDAGQPVHADFTERLKDAKARISSPKKWALDPRRDWVRDLKVHPYMHWIQGRPLFGKSRRDDVFYWHFRGISTNWKEQRTRTEHLRGEMLEVDKRWVEVSSKLAR